MKQLTLYDLYNIINQIVNSINKNMKKIIAITILVVISLNSFSQNTPSKKYSKKYSLQEIVKMNPRDVEDIGSFRVTGIIGGTVNAGFTNALVLHDKDSADYYMWISSDKKTLPGKKGDTVILNITFSKQYAAWGESVFLFKEE